MPYVPDPLMTPTRPDPETLVMANLHLARAAAKAYANGHPSRDYDDAYSDCLLGLWEAARKAAREGLDGADFRRLSVRVMQRRVIDGMRLRNGLHRKTARGPWVPRFRTIPLSEPVAGSLTVAQVLADRKARRPDADMEDAEAHLLRRLPDRHRRVLLACVVEEMTGPEVAEEFGVCESYVSILYRDAVREVREAHGLDGDGPRRAVAYRVREAAKPRRRAA